MQELRNAIATAFTANANLSGRFPKGLVIGYNVRNANLPTATYEVSAMPTDNDTGGYEETYTVRFRIWDKTEAGVVAAEADIRHTFDFVYLPLATEGKALSEWKQSNIDEEDDRIFTAIVEYEMRIARGY